MFGLGFQRIARRNAAAWSPDTADLLSWVELRNGYTTDVGVTSVPDLGSVGGALTQTTDADEPAVGTLGDNAVAAATFDGADSNMLHTAAASNFSPLHDGTGATLYLMVEEPLSPDTLGTIFATHRGSSAASHTGFDLLRNGGGIIFRITNASGSYVIQTAPAVANGAKLLVVRFGTAATPDFDVRSNGAGVTSVTSATGTPASGPPDSAIMVGESVGTGNHLKMNLGGWLLYGAYHTDEVVAANEAGLNAIYGLFS